MGNKLTPIAYPYYTSSRQLDDLEQSTPELRNAPIPSVILPNELSKLFETHHTAHWEKWSRPGRPVIDKVSAQLRMKDHGRVDYVSLYDPIMVALGPYHHGKGILQQAEEFKYLSLHLCCDSNESRKIHVYHQILGRIKDVRDCYDDEKIVIKYGDEQLALMMLLDSSFILNFMETLAKSRRNNRTDSRTLAAADPFMARDILVLENQIPFFVLNILINTIYDSTRRLQLLQRFFGWILHEDTMDDQVEEMFHDEQNLPLHILEACWKLITARHNQAAQGNVTTTAGLRNQHNTITPARLRNQINQQNTITARSRNQVNQHILSVNYLHTESARELKSKGIHFGSTSSCFLNEIRFESRLIYGQLKVPTCYVSDKTQVMLANMIAYELSPNTPNDLIVLSYTQFMKALIQTPEDVKVLQNKGVFHRNAFANPKQVVKFYKNINTLGMGNSEVYEDVIYKVAEHSNSKANTWLAEVVHDYLRSPWAVIGLLTAILLVVLTVLQTYYTMFPAN